MKSKNFEKKLKLNKVTLSNLDFSDMQGVKGGEYTVAWAHTEERVCIMQSCIDCSEILACQFTVENC
jgi:hypothetical protein